MKANEFMALNSTQMMDSREQMTDSELSALVDELFAESKRMESEGHKAIARAANDDEVKAGAALRKSANKWLAIANVTRDYYMNRTGQW